MKRFFLLFAVLSVTAAACKEKGSPNTTPSTDTTVTAHTDSPLGREAVRTAEPTPNATADSPLRSLVGMTVEEAMELDHFRERLEQDWGDAHSTLISAGATFEADGTDYIVASGETKNGGFTWGAIIIIDLAQDAVFAAQYDGENKRIDQFEEEKEGLSQPLPLTRWVAKYPN